MKDLLYMDYNVSDSSLEQYVNEKDLNMKVITNVSKVNILIGKNNSGKSRFMRNILKNRYYFCEIEKESSLNGIAREFCSGYRNITGAGIDKIIKSYEENLDTTNMDIIEFFWSVYKKIIEMPERDYSINRCYGRIENIINSLKKEVKVKKIYIPILRGIEKFANTTDKFMASDDNFKLTEGERKSLDSYIGQVDKVYINKVKGNYFKKEYTKGLIHTGEDMYDEIQQMLLGKTEDRKIIRDYEEFLSKNFFENKSISLIPNILDHYLYINIDGEEYELHNL